MEANVDLKELVKTVLEKFPEHLKEYKAGKVGLHGLFVGEAMKLSKGKAEPKELNRTVIEMLKEY